MTASLTPSSQRSCSAKLTALDFETKREQSLEWAEISAALEAGHFVWIDIEARDVDEARLLLLGLSLLDPELIDAALSKDPATQHARYEDYLHVVVSGCQSRGSGFTLERVDVVLANNWLVTIHRGHVGFLDSVRRDYRQSFQRFAKSPSFLLYELWDHLAEDYLKIQQLMEERVERLQLALQAEQLRDRVFSDIAELGSDLLHFRKIVLPARAVLADLATRRSPYVSELTQGYLSNIVGTLEHVLQDVLVDRDILSEAVNLHLSMMSHRTNQVMKRLTVVSVVFLPLTFLVGVYGMNFDYMPELRWQLGYLYFWGLATLVVAGIFWVLGRKRLL